MTGDSPIYPREWTERVPAVIFACLITGEMRVILHTGVGFADGGVPIDVTMAIIPFELRVPNARIWVKFDKHMREVIRVWRRDEE